MCQNELKGDKEHRLVQIIQEMMATVGRNRWSRALLPHRSSCCGGNVLAELLMWMSSVATKHLRSFRCQRPRITHRHGDWETSWEPLQTGEGEDWAPGPPYRRQEVEEPTKGVGRGQERREQAKECFKEGESDSLGRGGRRSTLRT